MLHACLPPACCMPLLAPLSFSALPCAALPAARVCATHSCIAFLLPCGTTPACRYDMVKSKDWSQALGRTLRWRYLVLDEGHRIKNAETELAHSMRLIQ
jgi:hypothetical protein